MVLLTRMLVVAFTFAVLAWSPAAASGSACERQAKTHDQGRACVAEKANRRDDQSYWSLATAGAIAAVAAVPLAYFFLRQGALEPEAEEPLTEEEAWARELGEDHISPAPG
jgi:hypothetical protein